MSADRQGGGVVLQSEAGPFRPRICPQCGVRSVWGYSVVLGPSMRELRQYTGRRVACLLDVNTRRGGGALESQLASGCVVFALLESAALGTPVLFLGSSLLGDKLAAILDVEIGMK